MKSFVVILCLALSHLMVAQDSIKGTIIDSETEKPVEGALIYAFELNKSVVTDNNGNYILVNNSKYDLKVEISADGYKTQVVTLSTTNTDIIKLDKNLIELQEVIITGDRNKSREKVSVSIETVKKMDLYQSGKISLADNLSKLPGLSNVSNGVGITKPVIRGLSNTNIVFLNNGIKAENFQFSSNHPFISDEFSAKKIEVIKGPVSLVYGSDAVGGVINVIKENPASTNSLEAKINTQYHTNTQGFVTNLDIKASGEKWYGGASFTNKSHKDYQDGNGDQIINTRFEELNLSSNIGYRSAAGNFALYFDYNAPTYGLTNQKSLSVVNDDNRKVNFWNVNLDNKLLALKNKIFIGEGILDVNMSYQQNIRKGISDDTSLYSDQIFASMDLATISYNAKFSIQKNTSKYTLGFNGAYIENDADDFYGNSNPMPDTKINDIGFFVLDEIDLSDALTLNAGLRYDLRTMKSFPFESTGLNKYEIDNDYSSLSGSVGSTYKVNNHLFKFNIASGFRSPNISELTQNGIHQARFERGDVTLKSQRNYQLDLNYHFHIDKLVFDVSPFYNKVNDFIYIVQTTEDAPIGGGKVWQYVQNDALLYGGEIALDYHPSNWLGLHTNYTYTRGELIDGGNLTQIPQNRYVAEVKLQKNKIGILKNPYFVVNLTSFQSQDNLGQSETFTPGYELFNVNFGSKITIEKQVVHWYISANNLFDKVYIDHLSSFKPLGLNNIGRNIVFGLNIPFTTQLKPVN
ncbi:TonB-dependent receptor [Maribacter sp. ANRC-HE7]|uniref:TonB-dependent receptor n=1 Tax=Maribacter aquimaris TaxID=2737171 RepID=A0ABR7V0M6_9FLAO|nr:TonB-dependent receptor [Maribacter aquimaris]MBD0777470.1 TonB-dependent receptor [Maribacter aquimaris]